MKSATGTIKEPSIAVQDISIDIDWSGKEAQGYRSEAQGVKSNKVRATSSRLQGKEGFSGTVR